MSNRRSANTIKQSRQTQNRSYQNNTYTQAGKSARTNSYMNDNRNIDSRGYNYVGNTSNYYSASGSYQNPGTLNNSGYADPNRGSGASNSSGYADPNRGSGASNSSGYVDPNRYRSSGASNSSGYVDPNRYNSGSYVNQSRYSQNSASSQNRYSQNMVAYDSYSKQSVNVNPSRYNTLAKTSMDSPVAVPNRRSVPHVTRSDRKLLTKEERLANKQKLKTRMSAIVGVVIVFLMCALMLYRNASIFGKNQEIQQLTSDYNKILITNEAVQSSIDKSVELGNLESTAKNDLGMVSPDSSHIFYVDMGTKDEVVKSFASK